MTRTHKRKADGKHSSTSLITIPYAQDPNFLCQKTAAQALVLGGRIKEVTIRADPEQNPTTSESQFKPAVVGQGRRRVPKLIIEFSGVAT